MGTVIKCCEHAQAQRRKLGGFEWKCKVIIIITIIITILIILILIISTLVTVTVISSVLLPVLPLQQPPLSFNAMHFSDTDECWRPYCDGPYRCIVTFYVGPAGIWPQSKETGVAAEPVTSHGKALCGSWIQYQWKVCALSEFDPQEKKAGELTGALLKCDLSITTAHTERCQ